MVQSVLSPRAAQLLGHTVQDVAVPTPHPTANSDSRRETSLWPSLSWVVFLSLFRGHPQCCPALTAGPVLWGDSGGAQGNHVVSGMVPGPAYSLIQGPMSPAPLWQEQKG